MFILHKIKVFIIENIDYRIPERKMHQIQPTREVLLLDRPGAAGQECSATKASPSAAITETTHKAQSEGGQHQCSELYLRAGPIVDLLLDPHKQPLEIELSALVPDCHDRKFDPNSQQLHFDTTYEKIRIYHRLKVGGNYYTRFLSLLVCGCS